MGGWLAGGRRREGSRLALSFRAGLSFRAEAEGRSRGILGLHRRGLSTGTPRIPRLTSFARDDNAPRLRRSAAALGMARVDRTSYYRHSSTAPVTERESSH